DDQVAAVDDEGKVTGAGMEDTSVVVRYLGAVAIVPVAVPRPPLPASAFTGFTPVNPLDEAVLARLREARVPPSPRCSDAEFVRRAYLDACGILPTVEEAWAFLGDHAPDRRARLI